MKIIFDTDPGTDDALAIMMALNSPDIEILGSNHGRRQRVAGERDQQRAAAAPLHGPDRHPGGEGRSKTAGGCVPSELVPRPRRTQRQSPKAGREADRGAGLGLHHQRGRFTARRTDDVRGGPADERGEGAPQTAARGVLDKASLHHGWSGPLLWATPRRMLSSTSGTMLTLRSWCSTRECRSRWWGWTLRTRCCSDATRTGGAAAAAGSGLLAGRIVRNWLRRHPDRPGWAAHDPLTVVAALHPEVLTFKRGSVSVETEEGEMQGKTTATYGEGTVDVAVDVDAEAARHRMWDLVVG